MKKSIYVKIMIGLFIFSVATELLALVGLKYRLYYVNHSILNGVAIALLVLDIFISLIYLSKLLSLKRDVVLWTDITLGYALLRGIFMTIAAVITLKGTAIANSVEAIILLVVWVLFRKHLHKLLGITRKSPS